MERLLKTEAAARLIGLRANTLCKWRLTGEGPPFVRIGPRAIAYREVDVSEWLESRIVASTSEVQNA